MPQDELWEHKKMIHAKFNEQDHNRLYRQAQAHDEIFFYAYRQGKYIRVKWDMETQRRWQKQDVSEAHKTAADDISKQFFLEWEDTKPVGAGKVISSAGRYGFTAFANSSEGEAAVELLYKGVVEGDFAYMPCHGVDLGVYEERKRWLAQQQQRVFFSVKTCRECREPSKAALCGPCEHRLQKQAQVKAAEVERLVERVAHAPGRGVWSRRAAKHSVLSGMSDIAIYFVEQALVDNGRVLVSNGKTVNYFWLVKETN